MPLEMHRPQSLVVAVDQGIGQRLAQRPLGVVRHADAQQPHHEFLLAVAGADARFDLFHDAQQRPAEEVVDLNVEPPQ